MADVLYCKRCGGQILVTGYCSQCGLKSEYVNKAINTSKFYYNIGLDKAKVRDMTGAAAALTVALKYDKMNIDARNLLGLIYYEVGEVVEALSQWVISKNLQPENNIADEYLNEVQGNKAELENMNKAIRNFNLSLDYARHDSVDLAIIQLRSVISQHPKMIKAYQLLALLYIKEEEYSKAGKVLKRALTHDKGNLFCLNYAKEIRGKISRRKQQATYAEQQMAQQAADEVIIPKYSEKPKVLQLMLGLILGIAICASAYAFMIYPTQQQKTNARWNQTAASYNEKLGAKDETISTLNTRVSDLENEVETMKKDVDTYTGDDGSLTNYERLLTAMKQYTEEDWTNMAVTYASINPDVVEASAFRDCYAMLKDFIENNGLADRLFEAAKALIDQGKYTEAIPALEACLAEKNDYEDAIYYMAFCYEATGNDAEAAVYFKRIVDEFPQSQWYSQASSRVN